MNILPGCLLVDKTIVYRLAHSKVTNYLNFILVKNTSVRFSNEINSDFSKTLRQRVANFFAEHRIPTTANAAMVIKSISLLTAFVIVYSSLFVYRNPPIAIFCVQWILLGIITAGIGFSVMHDANHGAYSSRAWVNKLIGYTLNLIGGNVANWKIQHNTLHHLYTNIEGLDEDITNVSILRFSPHQPRKAIHRFQHIYAWALYGLMTLSWVLWGDFIQLFRFRREGLLQKANRSFGSMLTELVASKAIYIGYSLLLPLLLIDLSWYTIVAMYLLMHFVTGFILAVVFQSAHVMPSSQFPLPEAGTNQIANNWAIHQLSTTTNFAPRNWLLTWYAGGLNHQIEHHLFPTICHIHYHKISAIVERTAREYGLPYHVQPGFVAALRSHGRLLRRFGRE